MSTFEYNDLFIACQETAPYHMFTFDIEGSKQMDNKTRLKAQYQIIDLAITMYRKLQKKEIEENKKILVWEDDFIHMWDEDQKSKGIGMKSEPFVLGDMVGLTIHRDSVSKEDVYSLYEETKHELNINFNMHLADGFYETNDYGEGGRKYFRGYCVDLLSNLHKDKYSEVREALSKKRK